jgi:phosphatidylglycerophosphate synthase
LARFGLASARKRIVNDFDYIISARLTRGITPKDRTISHDTWMHRIVRIGVEPLANTPVTPNHLTTLRLVTGLSATACYGTGIPLWTYIGSALFVLSLLLDRADGALARLSGKASPGGHRYDLLSDFVCTAAVFVGIGFGVREGFLGLWGLPLGVLAGAAVASIMWLVMRAEQREGARAAELKGAAGFDPDDAMFLVPVAMALGWGVYLTITAAFGASAFALFFFWKFRRFVGRNDG